MLAVQSTTSHASRALTADMGLDSVEMHSYWPAAASTSHSRTVPSIDPLSTQ